MELKLKSKILWLGALGLGLPLAASEIRCGGDGPQPFENATENFHPKVELIEPASSVEDFILWEKKGKIVYRSADNHLNVLDPESGLEHVVAFGTPPLNRLPDRGERYVATEPGRWLFDVARMAWSQIPKLVQGSTPVFWHEGKLFFLKSTPKAMGQQVFGVYSYDPGVADVERVCQQKTLWEEDFFVGEGHEYPEVVLYQVMGSAGNKKLAVWLLNLDTCRLTTHKVYRDSFEVAVTKVVRFRSLDSYAIGLDQPTRNLLWDDADGCRIFTLEPQIPIALDYRRPVLATWEDHRGLKIYHFKTGEVLRLLGGGLFGDLGERNISLHDSGDQLTVSPKYPKNGARRLFRVRLSQPISETRAHSNQTGLP